MRRMAILALVSMPAVAAAQGVPMPQPLIVTGHVTSGAGMPEANVVVRIERVNASATTAIDGSYRLVMPAGVIPPGGTLTITAARDGLVTNRAELRITPAPRLTQDFAMERVPAGE